MTDSIPDSARQQFEHHIPDPVQGIRCTFCRERALGRAEAMMTRAGQSWRMTLACAGSTTTSSRWRVTEDACTGQPRSATACYPRSVIANRPSG